LLRTFAHVGELQLGSPDFIIGEAGAKALKCAPLFFASRAFPMNLQPITALSPLDGRYESKVSALREHFPSSA
jgi:hypothetical protein